MSQEKKIAKDIVKKRLAELEQILKFDPDRATRRAASAEYIKLSADQNHKVP